MGQLRLNRIADQIRDVLAGNFLAGKLNDPRLQSVTITAVRVSADLLNAYIYFRVYFDANVREAHQALERAKGLFRKQLAEQLDLKKVPDLKFFFDESIERGARIEELVAQIAEEKKLGDG